MGELSLDILGNALWAALYILLTKFKRVLYSRHPRITQAALAVLAALWLAFNGYLIRSRPIDPLLVYLVSSGGFLFFAVYELSRFWSVGLQGADRSVRSGIDYGKALSLCQDGLDFLGTGASKLTSLPEFERAILRCHRDDQPIRFLLLDPDQNALASAAQRAGRDRDEYNNIVRHSLGTLARLKNNRQVNIEVRFYKAPTIPLRMMFINRSLGLVSYNVYGEGDGSQLPQLHLVKCRPRDVDSFYWPFWQYFETTWRNAASTAWDFKRYLT